MSDDEKFAARPGMTDEVLYARDGRLGQILLNRPKVINALTGPMVTSVLAQLQDWAQDDAVLAVSIQGAGERGLCAGNDVRALREGLMQGHGSAGAVQFWAHESHLNAAIAGFPKPFVAFMDGIVMGGGVGISAHEACDWSPSVRGSPCPRPPSASSPTSDRFSCCPARRARSGRTWP